MHRFSDHLKEGNCEYCSNTLDVSKSCTEWDDVHHEDHHYHGISCDSCGKKNWTKVDMCSGHESVFEQKPTVDSILRKVQEG